MCVGGKAALLAMGQLHSWAERPQMGLSNKCVKASQCLGVVPGFSFSSQQLSLCACLSWKGWQERAGTFSK